MGPSSVDDMTSSSDGVWYPDSLTAEMQWRGVGGAVDADFPKPCNPFAPGVPPRTLVLGYTAVLAAEDACLQPYMDCCATAAEVAAERGNVAIAQQGVWPCAQKQGEGLT